jgi:phage-related protein
MIDWPAVGKAIGEFFQTIGAGAMTFFKAFGEGVTQLPALLRETFDAMIRTGVAKVNELIDGLRKFPGRVLDALAGLGTLLVDAGADMVRGLWNGIKGMGGWLASHVKRFVVDNTLGILKNALGIGSPSRVMADEVGRWLPAGIGVGVQEGMPALRALLAGVGHQAVSATSAGVGGPGVSFGPGSIVVQFNGGTPPTQQQAFDTGLKVGQGIMDAINRRGIAAAVKQHA